MARRPRVVAAAWPQPAVMVERVRELAALRACLREAGEGAARVVVVEGAAGIGKTALLQAARDRALDDGLRVLATRVPHLSTAAPYELLRRLLGPEVDRLGGPTALSGAAAFAAPLFTPGATVAAGVDYGCQWLLAGLADQGPLLLVIDDAHWADADSLRVVVDAAEDLQQAPIAIIVTARPETGTVAEPLLARLATLDWASVVHPAPLSEAGVATLLRYTFGHDTDAAFTAACAQASGGNVFYLRELVRPLKAAGLSPDALTPADLSATGPAALAHTMRWRLGELGPVATVVAQAAAVLGEDVPLADVAALAGVAAAPAGDAAAALRVSSILARTDPVAFLHPLLRAAVEQTTGPERLGRLHARAAALLTAAGAPASRIAEHLLHAPPTGAPEVVGLLLDEARRDLDAGSVGAARRLLVRAIAEPPAPALRPEVLAALATAERATGATAEALSHLTEVVDTGGREVALGALADLLELLYDLGDHEAAVKLHRRAFDAEPYGDTAAEVRVRAALLLHVANGHAEQAPDRLVGVDVAALPIGSGEERRLLLCAAIHHRSTGRCSPEEFVRHLSRVVEDLPSNRPLTYCEVLAALEATAFLASAEAMGEAEAILTRLQPEVARLRRVSPELQAEWSHRTILNSLRCGRFEEALTRLSEAEAFAARHGLPMYASLASYARGCTELERGDYPEAALHLLNGNTDVPFVGALGELLCGRPAEALARLGLPEAPGAPVTEAEITHEAHLVASHAYERLGDRVRALREADRELLIRRRHGPSYRLALALRRRSSFAPAREAVELLAEAVTVCAGTPRLPVLARVRASHGAALRRAGRLREARAELAAALDLAVQVGMDRLAGHLADEIRAAGGRPRRTRVTGVASLTAGQAAVAKLAAGGCTNREIAEHLYITIKTVETHLNAVYRKLAVPGREHLTQFSGSLP
ncbi:helix-turn-helix transcriptional regulator [Paractinoplanes atraurantiacus]|uniref:Regulatory protein, luxR family n=1 Tax=Paractinoplanes atraurantiacus TaxID=1036182 RepID=A0A285KCB4_9ACTN|nr:AAA family ATPase [Actinoplanes atraurantiacus]SNY69597.1 regulatory protein, luxR family [Actinoplanes atraurantiacus]